jgi:hypothetical protein
MAKTFLMLVFGVSIASASASEFPVTDAQGAIAIAKNVCGDPLNSPLRWGAQLNVDKRVWTVTTGPSICPKLTTHLWIVTIPIDGPKPTLCMDSLYTIECD